MTSLDSYKRTNFRQRFSVKVHANSADGGQSLASGNSCRIKVIGVGGGGGNAVNRMMESSLAVAGVEFWVVNTDVQALSRSIVPQKLSIGTVTSRYNLFL